MTLSSMVALFGAMTILALIPSPSVFAVVARAIASGFTHGLVTTVGVVTGDFVFILLAIYGLSAVAETTNSLFVLVKYLGGAYLIWLGIGLWRTKAQAVEVEGIRESSWLSNFLCGLLITLSDPRAILFYVSFFPAFLDVSDVSIFDAIAVMTIATVAVGGSKLVYAYTADKSRLLFNRPGAKKALNLVAGTITIGTGIFLMVKN